MLEHGFSSELVGVLESMLTIDERARPDFIALDRSLSAIPRLFGNRISELMQPPDLLRMKAVQFVDFQEAEKKKKEEAALKARAEAAKVEREKTGRDGN